LFVLVRQFTKKMKDLPKIPAKMLQSKVVSDTGGFETAFTVTDLDPRCS
jgi:hypothetical protein